MTVEKGGLIEVTVGSRLSDAFRFNRLGVSRRAWGVVEKWSP